LGVSPTLTFMAARTSRCRGSGSLGRPGRVAERVIHRLQGLGGFVLGTPPLPFGDRGEDDAGIGGRVGPGVGPHEPWRPIRQLQVGRELMGLRQSDLDLDQAVVKIERSAVEVGTAVVVKAPKTAAGVRTVALPAWLVPELVHHLATYADPAPDGRVFVGLYGATPLRRNFATIWKRAKQAAGAGVPDDLHFHDLRHAGNHFAAASGASTRELMGRMVMRAALIYQHRTAERDRMIADSLDAMIRDAE
jgi:Phage integrase family